MPNEIRFFPIQTQQAQSLNPKDIAFKDNWVNETCEVFAAYIEASVKFIGQIGDGCDKENISAYVAHPILERLDLAHLKTATSLHLLPLL